MVSPAVRQPDFGVARLVDATATKTNSRVGTQATWLRSWSPVGRSCDVCSLGVLLYEALVGRPPFTGVCALMGEEGGTAPPATTGGTSPATRRRTTSRTDHTSIAVTTFREGLPLG